MCGIAAYVGKNKSRQFVLEGLSRLEYRGYDSAGFVSSDTLKGALECSKAQGRLGALKQKLEQHPHDGSVGMGHTRWATHGIATEDNAHPHTDCHKRIALVHNGIIEGFEKMRDRLERAGHTFASKTDTETVAHLFESILDTKPASLVEATVELVDQLEGAFAFVFMLADYPDTLLVVRHRSPVAVGVGEGEMFVGSDSLVFSDRTHNVIHLPDKTFAIVTAQGAHVYTFAGVEITPPVQKINERFVQTGKQGFEHYMQKEIYEQKQAIDRTISYYRLLHEKGNLWKTLGVDAEQIACLRTIHILAAGTSWHAGRIAQFFFELITKVPTRVSLASEFRYMPFFPEEDSLYITVSQSGETADTLEALRLVKQLCTAPLVALTNVGSSSMVREAGGGLIMQAGPEISVCSTKAFSCQVASLYWLAHRIGLEKGIVTAEQFARAQEDLFVAAEILEAMIEQYKESIVSYLAPRYAAYKKFIFLGRYDSYPFAMEAALKLKEISYIFAQCYPSGELKHGPIALVDLETPVVLFSVLDPLIYAKVVSNAQEVKARSGHLLVFAFEGQEELINLADTVFIIPRVAPLLGTLAMTGLMQFFVYQITKVLGLPIDKPRNLAKSVTVE